MDAQTAKAIRDKVDRLCKLGNEPLDGNSEGNVIAQDIRALLSSAEEAKPTTGEAIGEAEGPDLKTLLVLMQAWAKDTHARFSLYQMHELHKRIRALLSSSRPTESKTVPSSLVKGLIDIGAHRYANIREASLKAMILEQFGYTVTEGKEGGR